MSAHIVVFCDGHRYGQDCQGMLRTGWLSPVLAGEQAGTAGWRTFDDGSGRHLCPSPEHDEERQP